MTQPAAGAIPAAVDALAAELVALYGRAEARLLETIALAARHGLTDSGAAAQVTMLIEMRRAAERAVTALKLRSGPLAQLIAREAATRGDTAAQRLLRRLVEGDPRLAAHYLTGAGTATGHAIAAANAIATDLEARLESTHRGILRFADDAYRAAIADAAGRLVQGRENLTPATAQSLAWRNLTRQGITGFTDSAGKQWNLASYVEVATRTAVQRAYNAAHDARMTSVGIDYFTVTHDGRPCPLCKPWEGAILGPAPGRTTQPHAANGEPVSFTVTGTLEQARAAGLQHPNCKHVLLPYLPGVTKTQRQSVWTRRDENRYSATQHLRSLERAVRAAKREQAAALDDLTRQRATRRIRALQERIRAHVADHALQRRRRREQVDLGN